jgi:hypothetical protein
MGILWEILYNGYGVRGIVMDDKERKNLREKIFMSYFNIGFMMFIYLSNFNIHMGVLKAVLITQ